MTKNKQVNLRQPRALLPHRRASRRRLGHVAAFGFLTLARCGGAPDEPVATSADAVVSCRTGFHLECEPGCPPFPCIKPVCTCEPDPPGPPHGSITPTFYITHVVYAPPGRSSRITYTAGNTFGSTTMTNKSFKTDVKVTASGSLDVSVLNSGGITVTAGRGWGSTSMDSKDIAVETTSGLTTSGAVDDVDHNRDVIWFLAHPKIDVTIVPASGANPQEVQWSFAANQTEAVPYFVYVGWLRDPSTMPDNVRQQLDDFQITPDLYPQLLKADPFSDGAAPNAYIDPARFDPATVSTFPYEPPDASGDPPMTQTFAISRKETNANTDQNDVTYSVGVMVQDTQQFTPLFKATLMAQSTWTWTTTTSKKESTGTSSGESLTVGQPTFDYEGPTLLHVYVDKIWKTYLFTLDWDTARLDAMPNGCDLASRHYGIVPGLSWGFAPSYVQAWWTANGCNTDLSSETCEAITEDYGTSSNGALGYAPADVQSWWIAHSCPSTAKDPCQAASDRFGINAYVTWGFAPPYVQRFWIDNQCATTPSGNASACQRAADAYRICNGVTWGFAPNISDDTTTDVQGWWVANGCNVCAAD